MISYAVKIQLALGIETKVVKIKNGVNRLIVAKHGHIIHKSDLKIKRVLATM